jgi:hypothetical protein
MTPQEVKDHLSTFVVLCAMNGIPIIERYTCKIDSITGKECHCLVIEYFVQMCKYRARNKGFLFINRCSDIVAKELGVTFTNIYDMIGGWDHAGDTLWLGVDSYWYDIGYELNRIYAEALTQRYA